MSSPDHPTVRIHMTGWSCNWSSQVLLIGETPKRYRIQAIKRLRLPGRDRFLEPGESALVPKYCISSDGGRPSPMFPPPPPSDANPEYKVIGTDNTNVSLVPGARTEPGET